MAHLVDWKSVVKSLLGPISSETFWDLTVLDLPKARDSTYLFSMREKNFIVSKH